MMAWPRQFSSVFSISLFGRRGQCSSFIVWPQRTVFEFHCLAAEDSVPVSEYHSLAPEDSVQVHRRLLDYFCRNFAVFVTFRKQENVKDTCD